MSRTLSFQEVTAASYDAAERVASPGSPHSAASLAPQGAAAADHLKSVEVPACPAPSWFCSTWVLHLVCLSCGSSAWQPTQPLRCLCQEGKVKICLLVKVTHAGATDTASMWVAHTKACEARTMGACCLTLAHGAAW